MSEPSNDKVESTSLADCIDVISNVRVHPKPRLPGMYEEADYFSATLQEKTKHGTKITECTHRHKSFTLAMRCARRMFVERFGELTSVDKAAAPGQRRFA